MTKFKPLLAATIESDENLAKLPHGILGSPKIDGIRCLIHPELGPVTRSLKPIANRHIRKVLSDPMFSWFDGEITAGASNIPFQQTASAVMSHGGEPHFKYHVFDSFSLPANTYAQRLEQIRYAIGTMQDDGFVHVSLVEQRPLSGLDEILEYEKRCLEQGYEGIMLRHPNSPYKFGRSTLLQQHLMKLKRFLDDEATIIGFEPLERNTNVQTRNALGLAERSSHKAGKIADNLLGALQVQHHSFGVFSIGSGFDVALREEIWNNQEKYLGREVTFKYQLVGILNAPRFPIFRHFRPQE